MSQIKYSLNGLIVLLSAFFISCEKEDPQVGGEFQEAEGTFSNSFVNQDHFSFEYSTLTLPDSASTEDIQFFTVGAFSDDITGTVTSNSYFELGLSSEEPDFGDNPVCDSIILTLVYEGESDLESRYRYGSGDIEILVKQLAEEIDDDEDYTSSSSLALETETLGSITVDSDDESSSIDIVLSNDFGDDLMSIAQGLDSDNFLEEFFGLALVSGTSNSITSFNHTDSDTRIRVYYTNDEESTQYDFNIGDGLEEFVQYEADYADGYFSAITEDETLYSSTLTSNSVGMASGTAMAMVMDPTDMQEFFDTVGVIAITKATFTINTELTYEDEIGKMPLALIMYEVEDTDNLEFSEDRVLPHNEVKDLSGNGYFDPVSSDEAEATYEIDLSYYFQEIANGSRDLKPLLLSPNVQFSILNLNGQYRRFVTPTADIKFELTYSKLD